jgi:hypothetical protein
MAAQTTAHGAVTRLQGVLARRAGQPWVDACTLLTQAEVDTVWVAPPARAASLLHLWRAPHARSPSPAPRRPHGTARGRQRDDLPPERRTVPVGQGLGALLEASPVAEMPGALFSDAAGSAQLAFEKGGFLIVIGTAAPDAQAIALAKLAAPRVS